MANLYTKCIHKEVFDAAQANDEIIIISGYASPSTVEEICKLKKKTTFVYGMYKRGGIPKTLHDKFLLLNTTLSNVEIRISDAHHVHSKCYVFKSNDITTKILLGSANCSNDGLGSPENCEILAELVDNVYFSQMDDYVKAVLLDSVACDDPSIIPYTRPHHKVKMGVPFLPVTDPFSVSIPLYIPKTKEVQEKDGLNWGLQEGHHSTKALYAEACIRIRAEHVDNYPALFPPNQLVRSTSTGKKTRQNDPFEVLWDDNMTMTMLFQGDGVERPTEKKRTPTDPYRLYPKQLTAASGGAELGEYLRKRMVAKGVSISPKEKITYKHLKKYGRDSIQFTLTPQGYYEADFSI